MAILKAKKDEIAMEEDDEEVLLFLELMEEEELEKLYFESLSENVSLVEAIRNSFQHRL